MEKKKWLLAVTSLVLAASNSYAAANESAEWLADKEKIERLADDGKCEEYWDILWPWAKMGHLEARINLLTLMAPPPDGTAVFAPGSSGDLVSRMRDIVVMAVHSDGYKGEADYVGYYKELAHELYVKQGFPEIPEGRKFLECVKSRSEDCADIAVAEKLVPSFDEYAAQIDTLSAAGLKSTCSLNSKTISK